MKRIGRFLLAVVMLVGAVGMAGCSSDEAVINIAGTWLGVDTSNSTHFATLRLTQDGKTISGTAEFSSGGPSNGTVTGTIDGTDINFTLSSNVTVALAGTVNDAGTSMQGSYTATGGYGSGNWAATRQ